MRGALADAGLQPAEIAYLNLHGTGTSLNDRMESSAISRVFGVSPPCSSTKSLVGHTLGAAGAMEAGFCWLVLREPSGDEIDLIPHAYDGQPDPELPALRLVGAGHARPDRSRDDELVRLRRQQLHADPGATSGMIPVQPAKVGRLGAGRRGCRGLARLVRGAPGARGGGAPGGELPARNAAAPLQPAHPHRAHGGLRMLRRGRAPAGGQRVRLAARQHQRIDRAAGAPGARATALAHALQPFRAQRPGGALLDRGREPLRVELDRRGAGHLRLRLPRGPDLSRARAREPGAARAWPTSPCRPPSRDSSTNRRLPMGSACCSRAMAPAPGSSSGSRPTGMPPRARAGPMRSSSCAGSNPRTPRLTLGTGARRFVWAKPS